MRSLTGTVSTVTKSRKIWRSFQVLGDIVLGYSYSNVLIEIQDTIKSPPSEAKMMNKASQISVGVKTLLYVLFGCFGYAAFGGLLPEKLLTGFGFGFHGPYWLIDIANAAIVINLIGAYQVYCQPLFALVEKQAAERFPNSEFISKEIKIPIPGFQTNDLYI
ncbi:hypothetical protein Patl1_08282 [Pistacia atlantica]|uniref:Uncharacterized protein n=1 Tax=Pistacia atlantica TaxID=434234 RepID=A0ACC1AJQ1_9ROSI|nr:hypothetical protein Patl1_08282 [Pistacia atlantica]